MMLRSTMAKISLATLAVMSFGSATLSADTLADVQKKQFCEVWC